MHDSFWQMLLIMDFSNKHFLNQRRTIKSFLRVVKQPFFSENYIEFYKVYAIHRYISLTSYILPLYFRFRAGWLHIVQYIHVIPDVYSIQPTLNFCVDQDEIFDQFSATAVAF